MKVIFAVLTLSPTNVVKSAARFGEFLPLWLPVKPFDNIVGLQQVNVKNVVYDTEIRTYNF